jgi:predicted nucleic acid-binding protein
MIAAGEAVFVDTNVLLTATAPGRPLHAAALAVLERWPSAGVQLCLSGQVVREYLVVATRPLDVNGLGLRPAQARRNVEAFLGRARVLEESEAVTRRLLELLAEGRVAGKRIHDAGIVATALAHGLRTLVTDDARIFRGLGAIEVLGLAAIDRGAAT